MNKDTIIKGNLKKYFDDLYVNTLLEIDKVRKENGEMTSFMKSFLKMDKKYYDICDNYIINGTPVKRGDILHGSLGIQLTDKDTGEERLWIYDDEDNLINKVIL